MYKIGSSLSQFYTFSILPKVDCMELSYKEKQGFLELMRITITDLVGSLWSEIKLLTFIVDSSVYYSLTLSATFITSCLILFSIGRGQLAEIWFLRMSQEPGRSRVFPDSLPNELYWNFYSLTALKYWKFALNVGVL